MRMPNVTPTRRSLWGVAGLFLTLWTPPPIRAQADAAPAHAPEPAAESVPAADGAAARVAADDSRAKAGWRWALLPAIFSTPETGVGGGAGLLLTHRSGEQSAATPPQALPVFGLYTEKGQTSIAFAPELHLHGGDWTVELEASYVDFPSRFYGVGRDAPREAEESYTLEATAAEPVVLRRILSHLRVGLAAELQAFRIRETEPFGLLESGAVLGHDRGRLAGIGPVLRWDSRENRFYPARGSWLQLSARAYRDWLGGDYVYESYAADLRTYRSVAGRHIIAFQILAIDRPGRVPFGQLARLGRSLRGVFEERYVDHAALMGQIEYRFPIWRRFSGVCFAGAGDVAPRPHAWRLDRMRPTAGAGLRFAINPAERMNVRFDFAVGDEETQIYFQFLEAF
ncbi:MAG: hypothetical protein GF330_14770 [Candidatus Eisenbacteria bacterium]|nr:hypothetical protein [Candidatus Eisenbacteria bacterium]